MIGESAIDSIRYRIFLTYLPTSQTVLENKRTFFCPFRSRSSFPRTDSDSLPLLRPSFDSRNQSNRRFLLSALGQSSVRHSSELVAPLLRLRMASVVSDSVEGRIIPPGCTLHWDLTADDIPNFTTKLIEESRKVYDQVGLLKREEISFESVVKVSPFSVAFYYRV